MRLSRALSISPSLVATRSAGASWRPFPKRCTKRMRSRCTWCSTRQNCGRRSGHQSLEDLSELGSSRRAGASWRRFPMRCTRQMRSRCTWSSTKPICGRRSVRCPTQTGLLGHIEEIVRRGRVRGFIPWLITQRPAVVHKDVLSQADILIAMKLTASQDRDAIGAWIEGQADRQEGKRILGDLPRLQRGEGYLWAPGRGFSIASSFRRSAPSTARARQSAASGWRRRARSPRLPSPSPEMLRTLAAQGERYMDAAELAAVLGKKPSGGHWNSE